MTDTLLINICFSAFVLIMLIFYQNNIIRNTFDMISAIIAIIVSIFILYFKNVQILDIGHMLYNIGYLIPVAIFSKNKLFLTLNVIMLCNIIFSRRYYGECILSKKQNNRGFFTELNASLDINWDYIYPTILIITIYRLIHL